MKFKYILYGLIVYLFITACILLSLKSEPTDLNYDTIIILGNSPNFNNKPNLFLRSRIDKGISLYKKNKSQIILTGATKESDISEAEIMKQYCLGKGIANENIIIEDKAKSTKDNLIYSNDLMQNSRLKKAIVVTSSHHIKRTEKYRSLIGINNFEIIGSENNIGTFLATIPLIILEKFKANKIANI